MFDSIDVFTSRRNMFNECFYWCKTQKDIEHEVDLATMVSIDEDLNELSYEREPSGSFFANESNQEITDNQNIAGTFMFDEYFATLETNDDICELKVNDIVVYDGYVWRVTNIARIKKKRQSQFAKRCSFKTYISLKR